MLQHWSRSTKTLTVTSGVDKGWESGIGLPSSKSMWQWEITLVGYSVERWDSLRKNDHWFFSFMKSIWKNWNQYDNLWFFLKIFWIWTTRWKICVFFFVFLIKFMKYSFLMFFFKIVFLTTILFSFFFIYFFGKFHDFFLKNMKFFLKRWKFLKNRKIFDFLGSAKTNMKQIWKDMFFFWFFGIWQNRYEKRMKIFDFFWIWQNRDEKKQLWRKFEHCFWEHMFF